MAKEYILIFVCICITLLWKDTQEANNSSFSVWGVKTWQMGDSGGRETFHCSFFYTFQFKSHVNVVWIQKQRKYLKNENIKEKKDSN